MNSKQRQKRQNEVDAKIFALVAALVPDGFKDLYPNYSFDDLMNSAPDAETAFDIEWIGELRDRIGEIIKEKVNLPARGGEYFEKEFYPISDEEREFLRGL